MDRNRKLYLLYRILTVEGLASAVYMPWLLTEHHVSPGTVAALMALGDLALLLLQIPTGWLADRCGRKASLVLGSLAQALGALLFWNITGPGLMAAGAFLATAVGDAFRSGAQEALLYESCEPEAYARCYASSQAWLLAVLTGLTLAGGLVVQAFGYPLLWALETASALAGLGVALMMAEPRREHSEERHAKRRGLLAAFPWHVVLPATLTMVACSLAGFTLKTATAAMPPALLGLIVGTLPFVEMLGAALALRLPFGLPVLAAIALSGLAAGSLTPWAAALPYLAAGAAPALRSIALNKVASDADRASLDSAAGAFELVVGAAIRPVVGRVLGSGQAALGVPGIALMLAVAGFAGYYRLGPPQEELPPTFRPE